MKFQYCCRISLLKAPSAIWNQIESIKKQKSKPFLKHEDRISPSERDICINLFVFVFERVKLIAKFTCRIEFHVSSSLSACGGICFWSFSFLVHLLALKIYTMFWLHTKIRRNSLHFILICLILSATYFFRNIYMYSILLNNTPHPLSISNDLKTGGGYYLINLVIGVFLQ